MKTQNQIIYGGEDYRIVDYEDHAGNTMWSGWRGPVDSIFCEPENKYKRVIGTATGIRIKGVDRNFNLKCKDCGWSYAGQEILILKDSKYHVYYCDVCNGIGKSPFKWIWLKQDEMQNLLIRIDSLTQTGPL